VGALMQEMAAASEQQHRGVEQISAAMHQMNSVTFEVTRSSEASASAAEELGSQAESLKEMVQRFQLRGAEQVAASQAHAPRPTRANRVARSRNGTKKDEDFVLSEF
ncbi:MAG TPA: hypothetical protein VNS52_11490, partial [Gemmatimonadaceae bacterium]|nr:hypothetical protein [Gemmatimonadaceae bacterium]